MTSLGPENPVRIGEVILDKYRVERVIGQGGMGVVVAARHIELEQDVAIKFLLPGGMGVAGAIERFVREARAAARLRSQHVTTIYDVGRLPTGAPYLIMELLDGTDLSSLLRSTGRLRVADAVEFVIQACEAVAEAHGAGIIHRDLKPANLFLTRRVNGTPLIKVLDFGISKVSDPHATDASLTKTSDVVGSPYYMAPEQVRSAKDVDSRTDIWAIGVILYELIAGRVPFVAENVPQLCALLLETEPPPITDLRKDVPADLWAVIRRCLQKNPDHRYASVGALVHDLAPFASVGAAASFARADAPDEAIGFGIRSSVTLGETFQNSDPPVPRVRSSSTSGQPHQREVEHVVGSPPPQPAPAEGSDASAQDSAVNAAVSSGQTSAGPRSHSLRVLAFVTAAGVLAVVSLGTAAVVWMQRNRPAPPVAEDQVAKSGVVVEVPSEAVATAAGGASAVSAVASAPVPASASSSAEAPPSIATPTVAHTPPATPPRPAGTVKSTATTAPTPPPTRPPTDFLPDERK